MNTPRKPSTLACSSPFVFPTSTPAKKSTIGSTPVKKRGEFKSFQLVTEEAENVILGTDISIANVIRELREFIGNYTVNGERYYVVQIQRMAITQRYALNVDCAHFTEPLKKLVEYPQEMIPLMDHVFTELFIDIVDDIPEDFNGIKIRPFNIGNSVNMRELDPKDIDTLVSLRGLVIRCSSIIPDIKQAFFECVACKASSEVNLDRNRIEYPSKCAKCGANDTMQLLHQFSQYADRQLLVIQETPDNVPDGQTPHTVTCHVYDELVDCVRPGDKITLTGIFRAIPVRVNPRIRTVKSLFKTFVDCVHVQKTDKNRFMDPTMTDAVNFQEGEQLTFGEQEIAEFQALTTREDVFDILSNSIAPSIYGLEDHKKGLLLQLFGGSNKVVKETGARYRGDINVLLIGDPGTSKSQLLQYVHRIAPRGVYTSGKGSSAVGLTAYITRDSETKQFVLESGALVLSDGGICCIDEFDKMNDSTRSVLHEVMEQQTVSIAKAGIITTLNARTSILAAANPKESRYNPRLPIVQNVNLPPTLVSRFDLMYLVLDRYDETEDRRLANHLMSLYLEDKSSGGNSLETVPLHFLTQYITFAKKITPTITEEAADSLVNAYVELRKLGKPGKTISCTLRQLEAMVRLSEAHAKMRLSDFVTNDDVNEATRLVHNALQTAAIDPRTGCLDLDLITTGTSSADRQKRQDLKRVIKAILGSASVRKAQVYQQLLQQSSEAVARDVFDKALEEMDDVRFEGEWITGV